MIRNLFVGGILFLLLLIEVSCQKKEVILNEQQFTNLLIDMHRLDGVLAANRDIESYSELNSYSYYNDLFKKYGITQADFDSCMYFYSAQNKLFSKMYDVVIDSLNKQLTQADRVLRELRANDSLNHFPIQDTLHLDSVYTVVLDSLLPGLYKFSTTLRFDSLVIQRSRRIRSFFLSADEKDTLRVRDIVITPDTNERSYDWMQYADSLHPKLVICYMDIIPWDKRPKVLKDKKWVIPPKNEKVYQLEKMGVISYKNNLFRPYIPSRERRRWEDMLNSHR